MEECYFVVFKILWDVLIDTCSRSGEYYCYTVLCITLDYASEILVSLFDYYGSDSGSIFIFLFTMIFIQAQAMCITRVYDECTLAGYQEEKFITPVLFQKSFRFVISISLLGITFIWDTLVR